MDRFPSEILEKTLKSFNGEASIYIKDIKTGKTFEHQPHLPLPTASICKIPVMIELFKQASEDKLSLQDRHRLSSKISAYGSGVLSMLYDEPELTLYDYARLMISVSDNMATDVLINLLTPDEINATMDSLGFTNTRTSVTMGEYHYRFFGSGHLPTNRENDTRILNSQAKSGTDPESISYQGVPQNNITSAADMGQILEQLYGGKIVDPDSSTAMINLLKDCRAKTKIPRHLNTDVVVAHKIGGSNRIQGDIGIVYLPTGPLVISALTLGNDRESRGNDTIAELSKIAVGALSPSSLSVTPSS